MIVFRAACLAQRIPAALGAFLIGVGIRGRSVPLIDVRLEAAHDLAEVMGIVGHAQGHLAAAAQHHVHVLRRRALFQAQQP